MKIYQKKYPPNFNAYFVYHKDGTLSVNNVTYFNNLEDLLYACTVGAFSNSKSQFEHIRTSECVLIADFDKLDDLKNDYPEYFI
jgi:hypothetical protein